MKAKRLLYTMLLLIVFTFCAGENAMAAMEPMGSDEIAVRATGKFDFEVPGNTAKKASSSFPLETGEVVTIKATYSPFSASVDFGLIAPDGLFYGLSAKNGSFDKAIEVNQRGYYTLAVRNNSSDKIHVSGHVNY
mgnify:CR=1 FL=1